MPATLSTTSSVSSSSSSTTSNRRSYSPTATSSTSASTSTTTGPAYSSESWRTSATADIYNPKGPLPPSKPSHAFTKKPSGGRGLLLRIFVWRWRMWFESTFVLSMLEPWEKLMLTTIFVIVGFFFTSAIIKYLPHHVTVMKRRAMYYLIGQEGDERLLWQWLGLTQAQSGGVGSLGSGLLKEL